MTYKFEFYGWLLAMVLVLNILIMLITSSYAITGLAGILYVIGIILAMIVYAKLKKKVLLSFNYLLSAILSLVFGQLIILLWIYATLFDKGLYQHIGIKK